MRASWIKWYLVLREVQSEIDRFLEGAEVETKDVGPLTDASEKLHDLMDRVYQHLSPASKEALNE